jgi:hypothetical protein
MEDIFFWAQAVLKTTPQRWIQLTETLPIALLNRHPLEGEWSALECFLHLFDTEKEVFPVRVEYLLAGQDFPAFDPDKEGSNVEAISDPVQLANEFDRMRRNSLKLFDKISKADLDRRARHSELGVVSLRELLHEWAGHDLMHTVQAERALMQPLIAGAGPWKAYFSDHWLGE